MEEEPLADVSAEAEDVIQAESKELTAVELVRLRWQQQQQVPGSTVEDGGSSASSSATSAAVCLPTSSLAQEELIQLPSSLPAVATTRSAASASRRGPARRLVSSVSAPVLPPVDPQAGRGAGRASSESLLSNAHRVRGEATRKVSMLQDDLRQLPEAEALRQILIERTGSLKFAYKAMDVNGSGVVSPAEFEAGLQRARIFGSPLVYYRSVVDLFRGIDKANTGVVSLQELLGYMPFKTMRRTRDTRAQWISYNNKTSAQKSRLARKPKWKSDEALLDDDTDHVRRRRQLKHQLLDARNRGCLKMEEKRRLVRGLVSNEERDKQRQYQNGQMSKQGERIGDAINKCARARSELSALRQAMVQLAPEPIRRHRSSHVDYRRRDTAESIWTTAD